MEKDQILLICFQECIKVYCDPALAMKAADAVYQWIISGQLPQLPERHELKVA